MDVLSPAHRLGHISLLGVIFLLLLLSGCASGGQQAALAVESRKPTNTPTSAASPNIPSATTNANNSPSLASLASSGAPQKASAQSALREDSTKLAVVKSARANLREHPNKSSRVIKEVIQGDALLLISRSPIGSWYKVRHRETGDEGWIHGNGIVITSLNAQTEARESSTVDRESTGRVVTSVPHGSKKATSSGRTYRNVDGDIVPSPVFSSSVPAGASARCRDGSYSFSKHRRGTCSHHGGVAKWLRSDIP